ncbi:MAG: FAD-dependent oxidoreductase, partial [Verrucomicrobia bacterium]|nr:FAD-dependent oxidoreductase [Verrucomicrobiota bacterium]
MNAPSVKTIVVLGGGFGGLEFCRSFRHPRARIILIDRQNHHLFQPLLYQVATAGLAMPDIAKPLRSILSGREDIQVLMKEVRGVNLKERRVQLDSGTVSYDRLVLALGAVNHYFGHPEWRHHAIGLKSLHDAMRIRARVLSAFERAEAERDPERRRQLTTIVVIGGGPTGVEMAGALAELTKRVFAR